MEFKRNPQSTYFAGTMVSMNYLGSREYNFIIKQEYLENIFRGIPIYCHSSEPCDHSFIVLTSKEGVSFDDYNDSFHPGIKPPKLGSTSYWLAFCYRLMVESFEIRKIVSKYFQMNPGKFLIFFQTTLQSRQNISQGLWSHFKMGADWKCCPGTVPVWPHTIDKKINQPCSLTPT